ncbi:MAG TPA: hypothetical protein VIT24_04890, partial [Acidimicrobiales bacterium]
SELTWDDGRWHIVDDGTVLATYDDDQVRLSLSWKAKVYADEDERARADSGADGVDLDEALARLAVDLAASAEPELLAGHDVDSADLRDQLNRRYSAYAPSLAPT